MTRPTPMTTAQDALSLIIRFRRPVVILVHAALVVTSWVMAAWLRFDGAIPAEYVRYLLGTLPILVSVRLLVFVGFRLFQGLWRYTSVHDLRNIIGAVVISSLLFYLLEPFFPVVRPFPRSVLMIDSVLLVCLLTGIRLSRRIYRDLTLGTRGRRVLVFGAGDAGELIVRDMRQHSYDARPIGFLDDDPAKQGQRIHGLPVLGGRRDAVRIIEEASADEVLIAVPSAPPEVMRAIVRSLEQSRARLTTLPGLEYLIGRPVDVGQVRPLAAEDLLRREPISLDPAAIRTLVAGRRVLVTGAGGSIGSEICRQLAGFAPARLVTLDRYENSLFDLLLSLSRSAPDLSVHGVIGDVTDEARLDEVFTEHRPEIVFHAAAHKHVPLMEANPCEAVKNNVRGTRLLAQATQRHGCGKFVLISSDKAVNPTSVMGATKRVAELTLGALSGAAQTDFTVVRFGNVLASNGSVVPLFLDQIKRGGPVTVTHPDIRRYFMLISEAVQLVLHAATLHGRGCTYVLDMGEQVRLLDMARDLIRLSGYIPEKEIQIAIIGLRPGEKLYEELVGEGETAEPSPTPKILRLRSESRHAPDGWLLAEVDALERAAAVGDRERMMRHLAALVPNFSGHESAVRVS